MVDSKLLELRLNVINAIEEMQLDKAKSSVENKISGYTDSDILMNPEAMQSVISMLEQAKETEVKISNFGRSKLSIKISDDDIDGMVGKFGRSIKVSDGLSAADLVSETIKSKPKSKLFLAMEALENFLKDNGMQHPFRCKSEYLSDEDYSKMLIDANDIKSDDPSDKVKVLQQIKKMKKESLYTICKNKPYQCLSCPYYYEDMQDFLYTSQARKQDRESEKHQD